MASLICCYCCFRTPWKAEACAGSGSMQQWLHTNPSSIRAMVPEVDACCLASLIFSSCSSVTVKTCYISALSRTELGFCGKQWRCVAVWPLPRAMPRLAPNNSLTPHLAVLLDCCVLCWRSPGSWRPPGSWHLIWWPCCRVVGAGQHSFQHLQNLVKTSSWLCNVYVPRLIISHMSMQLFQQCGAALCCYVYETATGILCQEL